MGFLLEDVHFAAYFMGHSAVGEISGYLLADRQRLFPAFFRNRQGELDTEIVQLGPKDRACRFLQGKTFGRCKVQIQFFENIQAAVGVLTLDRVVPKCQ